MFGGGAVGLMGVVADAAIGAGGEVIGVIPEALVRPRRSVTPASPSCASCASMHERKALMAELSDAFVALPGGLGTFEELCEMLTWAQLGVHSKPVVILDVEGFYEPLFALFDRAVDELFLRPQHRELAQPGPQRGRGAGGARANGPAPVLAKWIGRDET